MTSIAVGNRRLLRLAKILDTADTLHLERHEPIYNQMLYSHTCGTPACALGHWAANNLKRWSFDERYGERIPQLKTANQVIRGIDAAEPEFALSFNESDELFGLYGCGRAQTSTEAAAYIRAFVAKRKQRK